MMIGKIVLFVCCLALSVAAAPRAQWQWEISHDAPRLLSLRAEQAPLAAIAAELAQRLKLKLTVSPLLKAQKITVEFDRLTLEEAASRLAPQVYADYESSTQPGAQTRCLALYLQTAQEARPALYASFNAESEAVVMTGETDEGAAPKEQAEPSLLVVYEQRLLTVKARQQPLSAVLYAVAVKLGASFDVGAAPSSALSAPVDVHLPSQAPEAALRQLSPRLTLYQRVDLHSGAKQLLRLVLAERVP